MHYDRLQLERYLHWDDKIQPGRYEKEFLKPH